MCDLRHPKKKNPEILQKKNDEKNLQKTRFFRSFLVRVVAGSFSSERAQKMLKNEVLDVEKFDDTAENEAFEVS